MRWKKTGEEFDASDDHSPPEMRADSIDEFLGKALFHIGSAYSFIDCPAIIFDLWSSHRLLVFDSPSGLELCRGEKVYTQLTNSLFESYCWDQLKPTIEKYGYDSDEYDTANLHLDNLTWSAVKKSLSIGKGKQQLSKFETQPTLVMITEGDDSCAHDLISGNRVAMLGKPIEIESSKNCQCIYCK